MSKRIFVVLQNQLYKALLAQGRRTISASFREAISELIEQENLKVELRRFYRRHSALLSKEVGADGKGMELLVREEAPEFLQSLSFFVLGHRNISQASRVMMYHYAVKKGWISAPPVGSLSPEAVSYPIVRSTASKSVTPPPDKRSDRRRQKISIGSLFSGYEITRRDLDQLARYTHLGRSATLRYLIEQVAIGDTPEKARLFFVKKWAKIDARQHGSLRIRYSITKNLDSKLDDLALRIAGCYNRSLVLRIIIAYMADELGIHR